MTSPRPSSSVRGRPAGGNQPGRGPPGGMDFICKPKYTNTLPDIPFDAKFMSCPFVPLERFVEYKPSTLEKNYKFELLCEMDMGVNIDLIDPLTYKVDPKVANNVHQLDQLDEKDRILIDDETQPQNTRRSAQHSKVVPWMRKTEYIAPEFNRYGVASDRQEVKVGYNLKKNKQDENLYRDRQSQLDAIDKTFRDVKKPVKEHFSKKGVYAVEECPLLPDFQLWKYPFALVVFDGDPALHSMPEALRRRAMEQSHLRGMKDDDGVEFVAYLTPSVETLQKRLEDKEAGRPYEEGSMYEYKLNREYTWSIRNKTTKGYEQDNFFIHFKDGNSYYNEMDTRVKLMRRRRAGHSKASVFVFNSLLQVTHCPPSEQEMSMMTIRMNQLLRPYDEKEEEEEEGASGDENEKKSGSDESGDEKKKSKDKDSSDEKNSSESDESGKSSSSSSSESENEKGKSSEEDSD
ncbi:hypothetical protein WR25_00357 [Diploscapter pachys]|uniref:RNA polymerase II-associated factor 1 homolog n=1 Tax=Diploscapter pachys TaxID=2018661 RepID=A0A2A2JYU0_9BILA|nr:hypothetical protein WR25_00357 [Diploscapter pachys]